MASPPKRPGPPAPDPNWELELHPQPPGAADGAPLSAGKDEMLAHALHRHAPRKAPILEEIHDEEERSTQPPMEGMTDHVARMMAEAELLEWEGLESTRPTRENLGRMSEMRGPVSTPRSLGVKVPGTVAIAARSGSGSPVVLSFPRSEAPFGMPDLSELPAVFALEDVGVDEPVSDAAISPSLVRTPSSAPALSGPFSALELSEPPAVDEESARVAAIATRITAGDYGRALVLAEAALEEHPDNPTVAQYAASCREMLYKRYLDRIGAASSVPRIAMQGAALTDLALDHRTGFLLSCVDGFSTIEEIIDVAAMPRLEAVRILYELVQEGAIEMQPSRR
jgi:hypothetical protein